ncbi:hypothetical protein H5410_021557 [Solanum commersonii]|uniref:Uncharacterized protein n=1 Tax=Solanum commersonii TaxID=4109 RepID=A0A9J5ZFG4_SOLCO|nr:hypothetical protein H5410_021557 [Solanum commersonii]
MSKSKKARLYLRAPIHPECSFSNENKLKTKDVVPAKDASKIGSNGDKGKQVVGASDQEFNFPISSIQPAGLRHKSANVLCHSLGSTLPGIDSSVLQSLAKADSNSVGPNSSYLKNLALNRNMNSRTCKTVVGVLAQ